jgi:hypothetical protein
MRSWKRTASVPSMPASGSAVVVIFAGLPWRARMRRANGAMTASRSGSGSTRAISVTGSPNRANPSTSSGVYVDPPPTTVIFNL